MLILSGSTINEKSGSSGFGCLDGITLVMDAPLSMVIDVGLFLGLQMQQSAGGGHHGKHTKSLFE